MNLKGQYNSDNKIIVPNPLLEKPFSVEAKELIKETGLNIQGKDKNFDNVNNPQHYTDRLYEVFYVLIDWFKNDPILFTVVKYLARAGKKQNTIEDLKKAKWYLEKRILQEEGKLENEGLAKLMKEKI